MPDGTTLPTVLHRSTLAINQEKGTEVYRPRRRTFLHEEERKGWEKGEMFREYFIAFANSVVK